MRRLAIALLISVAVAGPAWALDRAPAERQLLTDLAYVLGESHALRQACEGAGDMYWRSRMAEMLNVEAADQAFTTRLTLSFNSGYAAGQAGFPACDTAAREEMRTLAQRGKALAGRLSGP